MEKYLNQLSACIAEEVLPSITNRKVEQVAKLVDGLPVEDVATIWRTAD